MPKWYAVAAGVAPGVYMSWAECKAQVHGYHGAVYKSFSSEAAAVAFTAAHSGGHASAVAGNTGGAGAGGAGAWTHGKGAAAAAWRLGN